ncbi:methyltransferase domain-containing protein [Arthrobacter sp. I2-34]|uniref:Methyltransferase domain-containing protein n=1 Tax=Arthrobacter hankyongi TaxID=2904801 RepID=A0ABS9LA41_9MICC|nr:class I SAM-dependent methyltransferase [Arthrobacter hankyongi]MCG2623554.1 methyltransferase domain-containing protein [Arthrobacter hankyongi]
MDNPEDFWDSFYRERSQVWSGEPNKFLVREAASLAPRSALDLGCGEGADAIWLAQHGWSVTAIDISAVALGRAAAHAAALGLAGRIDWQQHDLAAWTPTAAYDLVSAQFLHSPVDFPREEVLRTAAGAVAPGGTLLVVGHEAFPPWSRHPAPEVPLPRPAEVADQLGLAAGHWQVETAESPAREVTGPDGQSAVLTDSVLRVRRLDH